METNIASERVRSGMNQSEVADFLGVSLQTVSRIETGKTMPDGAALCKLADRFGCSVDYLLRRTEDRR